MYQRNIKEYKNHEARIINEVVGTLDLPPLFTKYDCGGAPAYHLILSKMKPKVKRLVASHIRKRLGLNERETYLLANTNLSRTLT